MLGEICDAVELSFPGFTMVDKAHSVWELARTGTRVASFGIRRPIPSTKHDEFKYFAVGFDRTGVFAWHSGSTESECIAQCFADSGETSNEILRVAARV